uniref:Uncharacterized protein n=1 Tax=Anguilla anguilla TaxID=7936 RepID=A0A0E9XMJ0_ANGAN
MFEKQARHTVRTFTQEY